VVGERLLRSNILRPSTDIVTINTRLDLVELFLRYKQSGLSHICCVCFSHSLSGSSNNRVFTEVVALLQQFPDLDKMLTGLRHAPKQVTQKTARTGIDTLIYLKQALRTAPALADALSELSLPRHRLPTGPRHGQAQAQAHHRDRRPPAGPEGTLGTAIEMHPLVGAVVHNLRDPALQRMEGSILQVITESTAYSKSVHEMRHQECFALRAGIHGLLDVSRKTFLQTVEDLYKVFVR